MITDISTEFKEKIREYMHNYIPKAELLIMNNDGSVKETITLGTKKLMSDGISYTNGTSSTDSFDVGAAVIGSAQIVVDNTGDWLSRYDLERVKCILYVGMELDNGTFEYTKKGVFNMENPQIKSTTVTLSLLDNMSLFEKKLNRVNIPWPTKAKYVLREICEYCGVTLASNSFTNEDIIISNPEDEDMTCLDAVSYIAQIACSYAQCNKEGALELNWYKKIPADLDGGLLEDYETGDVASGGTLEDYVTGDIFDGGNYGDLSTYHHFYMLKDTPTVYANNTVISGCRIGYGDDNVLSYGTDGYVIEIADNPFITTAEIAQATAEAIMDKAVGMTFRKCSFTVMYDPTVEAGDIGYISDYKGYTYPIIVSNVSATLGGKMSVSSDSKTTSKQNAESKSSTEAIIKKAMRKEKNAREKAVEKLAQELATSSGMYETNEVQPDGSTIAYLHNKPTLKESSLIIKITMRAIGISNDGGKTYPYGLTINAEMIMNIIYANKISADYIEGGTLVLGGNNNTNGTIAVYDAKGNLVATLDKDGLATKNGSFEGTIKSANAIITGGKIDISTTDDSAVIRFTYTTESGSKVTNEFRAGSMRITNEDGSYVDIEGHIINIVDAQGNVSVVLGRDSPSWFNKGAVVENDMQIGEKGKTARIENWCDTTANAFYIFNDENTHSAPVNYEYNLFGAGWIKYSLHVKGGIYGEVASSTDSDENVKKDIETLDINKSAEFIYKLKPTKYKLKNGTSDRYHHGLIAQQAKDAMGDDDWGFFIDSSINNKDYNVVEDAHTGVRTKDEGIARYGLRYEELIADMIATLQSQNDRINELERIIKGN
jgi:hypothetical protein|nr:MAG TPA: endosialidase chaperone [Caudoviricetes sp.]